MMNKKESQRNLDSLEYISKLRYEAILKKAGDQEELNKIINDTDYNYGSSSLDMNKFLRRLTQNEDQNLQDEINNKQ